MAFIRKHLTGLLFTLALVINIITCLFIWSYAVPGQTELPQHYNIVSGFDEIGSRTRLYQIPLLGFVVVLVNYIFASRLAQLESAPTGAAQVGLISHGFIAYLASGGAVFVSLVLCLAILLLRWQT